MSGDAAASDPDSSRPDRSASAGATDRLRALVVCDDPPAPGGTGDGNTYLALKVLERLAREFAVTLVWFGGGRPPESLTTGCVAARSLPLRPTAAALLRSAVTRLPRSAVARDHPTARSTVRALSSAADVTYVIGPKSLALTTSVTGALVVNEVDPMSLYWADQAQRLPRLRRVAARHRIRTLRHLEQVASARADRYVVVNPDDAGDLELRLGRPVVAIPNGVRDSSRTASGRARRQVCFVGALEHAPNVDSARTLCLEIAPLLRAAIPGCRIVVAGRAPSGELRDVIAASGVTLLADVADVMDVYRASAVAVFPGGFGRGTRNSVLEALRCGCPVVASSASARGITRGPHLVVADDPRDFAGTVARLLRDDDAWRAAALAADVFGRALPTWDESAEAHGDVLRAAARKSVALL